MKEKMKAVVIYQAGGPEQLKVEDRAIPELKDGWSLVQVKGFGINHSEVFTREGHSPNVEFPRILGIECVGQVAASTSPDLKVGQTVVSIMGEMGRAFDGGYAEYALLPNEQIYPIETSLSWTDLAAVPETFYTAFGAFDNLAIKASDKILVRGASSGVGIAFMKLVKAQFPKIKISGSSRKLDKKPILLDLGFDDIVEDKDNCLQSQETFDKVLDLVGPAAIYDTLSHVNEKGIVAIVGLLGGQWTLDQFDPISALEKNVYLTTFHSANVSGQKMQALFGYIEQYDVAVSPEKVYQIDQIVDAHRYLEEAAGYGKVVVINDQKEMKEMR